MFVFVSIVNVSHFALSCLFWCETGETVARAGSRMIPTGTSAKGSLSLSLSGCSYLRASMWPPLEPEHVARVHRVLISVDIPGTVIFDFGRQFLSWFRITHVREFLL